MNFPFSKREMARRAAIEASDRWRMEDPSTFTGDGKRIEYWCYVVNAALAAIPDPDDQVGTRRAYKEAQRALGSCERWNPF